MDPHRGRRARRTSGDLPRPFPRRGWATKAIDELRRRLVGDLRRAGRHDQATSLKGSRWALLKNPHRLKAEQRSTLASIQLDNKVLYCAYLPKEQLRAVSDPTSSDRRGLLAEWLDWARRCQIPEFVKLAETITRYRRLIWNTLAEGLSNARSEATNTHLRALTKRAYGFHTPMPSSPWPYSPAADVAHPYPKDPKWTDQPAHGNDRRA